MSNFDPNSAAKGNSGIFGLPYTANEAKLVLIPVPWEATVSYGGGTSQGPELVLNASRQVDLYDLETHKAYEAGYFLDRFPTEILELNEKARKAAEVVIETGGDLSNEKVKKQADFVNECSRQVNQWLHTRANYWLEQGKVVAALGGDHSSPYGLIDALGKRYNQDFGILHIDAHADLRKAYEGFQHSHASIMFNVMNGKNKPIKLIQVGIRDFCEEEFELIRGR